MKTALKPGRIYFFFEGAKLPLGNKVKKIKRIETEFVFFIMVPLELDFISYH